MDEFHNCELYFCNIVELKFTFGLWTIFRFEKDFEFYGLVLVLQRHLLNSTPTMILLWLVWFQPFVFVDRFTTSTYLLQISDTLGFGLLSEFGI